MIARDSSLAKNSTLAATSSGRQVRCIGSLSMVMRAGSSPAGQLARVISVSTLSGCRVLQRIRYLRWRQCTATDRDNAATAPFEALYAR
ncbi:hypothetical protein D3C76_1700000 [compost metagenome]